MSLSQNKVYALEAWSGQVAWQSNFYDKIYKIFVVKKIDRETETESQEVALVTKDSLVYLDSLSGKLIKQEPLGVNAETTKFVLVAAEAG